jgi:hypothetical protein
MARERTRVDADGVRVTRTGRMSLLVPVVIVAGAAGWFLVRSLRAEAPRAASRPSVAPPAEESRPPDASAAPAAPARDPDVAERVRQRREERETDRRAKSQPTFTTNPPGEHAGMAAFPPPGTKPIKRGIVVPDDYQLPDGYVRHYQTTDDGRRLPPILMFRPDFVGLDAEGNPIQVPEDRIVPPELAPPGLPRRMLDETSDTDETGERRVRRDFTRPNRER